MQHTCLIEMAAPPGLKSTTGPTAHCHAIGAKPEVGSIRKYVAHWLSSAALSVLPSVPGFTCATPPTLVRALVCVSPCLAHAAHHHAAD